MAEEQRKQGMKEQKLLDNLIQTEYFHFLALEFSAVFVIVISA